MFTYNSIEEGEIDEGTADATGVVHYCTECQHLPVEEHCVRVWKVEEHAVGSQLKGTVLTFATGENVLPPKVQIESHVLHSQILIHSNRIYLLDMLNRLSTTAALAI